MHLSEHAQQGQALDVQLKCCCCRLGLLSYLFYFFPVSLSFNEQTQGTSIARPVFGVYRQLGRSLRQRQQKRHSLLFFSFLFLLWFDLALLELQSLLGRPTTKP